MANVYEARSNVRVKLNNYVSWRVLSTNRAGEGRVLNISTTGMLVETTADGEPTKDATFSFVSGLGMDNFIPQSGQLVWCRKKKFNSNSYLCGFRFTQISENILSKLQQRVQDGLTTVVKSRQLEKVSGVLVGLTFLILSGYVVWLSVIIYNGMKSSNDTLLDSTQQQAVLTQTYSNLYHVTDQKLQSTTAELEVTKKLYQESQMQLASAQDQLASVQKELETTKGILKETENMLAAAKGNGSQLKNEAMASTDAGQQELVEMKAALEKTIKTLEDNKIQLTSEVYTLREKINYLSGDVKNRQEGKELLALYADRAKVVKRKINEFKREAQLAHVNAMKEKDRIQSSLGNNGYLMKNGEDVHVNMQKYLEAKTDDAISTTVETKSKPKVEVDVNFVNN